MYDRTPIPLRRACKARMVPSGNEVILPEGIIVNVTQSLGGSFTVYVEGNLFRVAGEDADALGLEPPEQPTLPENHSESDVEKLVWEQMKTCYDPEIPINVVDLGLVYECKLNELPEGGKRVDVKMTLTAPGCGMGEVLSRDVKEKLESVPSVKQAHVEIVFDPPWNRSMMSDEAKLQLGMY
ncbi:MAG: putative Fe-S cluster assembly protein SufT [Gammaproteobacteria bacterium]|nr:putative Fe-S cluster assembly protein SufT [Gammaproteobacteria bacterium]MDE2024317.1 putative Fe-S cluster assembly protein SufT [Gammaproteobacteria bacterium]MDE2140616.1 putative Fe-S cluster assembly protein SufT [Gammaproteobacteria bacterium]MDE2273871.1 putative Fe-S cluster assembly protein SufT [Gammaproteobacteria bacterium]